MLKHLVALGGAAFVFSCGLPSEPEGPARFVSSWTFEPKREWVGGFSGLDTPDGTRFAMISDSGYFVVGRFQREAGRITGFDHFRVHTHKRPPLGEREHDRDAEGLAWTEEGFFVSREGVHEVWHFESPAAEPLILPQHPDFDGFGLNASLEALAITPDGALLTMPERPERGHYPLYRFADGQWELTARIPAPNGFRAVGADVGPDGWFYLLERRFVLPFAFASRVRRLLLDNGEVVADETLLVTPAGRFDNLEGLSVWRDAGGDLRLTMVSDDNYLRLQRIEYVEYTVPPALDPDVARR